MFKEQGKNIVLNENSVDRKPCINRESKSDEITIYLYSCHDINVKFPVVVTPPAIYQMTRLTMLGLDPGPLVRAFSILLW